MNGYIAKHHAHRRSELSREIERETEDRATTWHSDWIRRPRVYVTTALLIDEDPATKAVVRSALASIGCTDVQVATLREAQAVLTSGKLPDLVIAHLLQSDITTLRLLRPITTDVPILTICDEDDVDVAILAGAAGCVTRPVRERELVGRIRAAIRERAEVKHRASRERRLSDQILMLQREKQDLERLVCVDVLTGVANRRHSLGLLAAEWRRAQREDRQVALLMIDLDCYHAYNEQYGHLGGDACLQRVTEAMVKCLRRPSDFLGRYGGEEFIAVLPNTNAAGAKIVAERLRATVEALAIPHATSTCARVVTVTAGFAAMKPTGDIAMEQLIAVADRALLRAKSKGRNRVEGEAPVVLPSRMPPHKWQRYAPVYADPWFADRIPPFLAAVQDAASCVVDSSSAKQRPAITKLWLLKTCAGELGLPMLETLIADLGRAATSSDLALARRIAEQLIEYVTHVQVVYRRVVDPPHSASVAQRTG